MPIHEPSDLFPENESLPPAVLTIAGSDPSGGAGLQADLKTFQALGTYGMSVLTVATDCETKTGVQEVRAFPSSFVDRQLERVTSDIPPQAIKTGMLYSRALIETVTAYVRADPRPWFVLDPVMTTRRGEALLPEAAESALRYDLLPLADVLTPSIPEAERLLHRPINSAPEREEAARSLADAGPQAVVVTGGHAQGPASDCAVINGQPMWFESERRDVTMHGAGDTFSAALTAALAHGLSLPKAVRNAKQFVAQSIQLAPNRGRGTTPPGHACLSDDSALRTTPAD
ncbi:bifunctional hydroxymethylpyrimidine kinase/phosphomethylpyrimidine kinase [Salinibacter sp.]|uniref:bifunctional hydroxymethylpyrimidine kinase/phosphomethylpyrimidine kinase n=1 Tax=Salinibacter sp. TaxID=2065818 RepID=UPI0021E8108D|nr:bifunctional hydroxymethylpyrimidine kinase/phosphomethylpyrimidine kinase [Salinibacter sp.]